MEEIMTVYQLLGEIAPITNTLTRPAIGSLIGMLMEEWCKANHEMSLNLSMTYKKSSMKFKKNAVNTNSHPPGRARAGK